MEPGKRTQGVDTTLKFMGVSGKKLSEVREKEYPGEEAWGKQSRLRGIGLWLFSSGRYRRDLSNWG